MQVCVLVVDQRLSNKETTFVLIKIHLYITSQKREVNTRLPRPSEIGQDFTRHCESGSCFIRNLSLGTDRRTDRQPENNQMS